jgi:hypothetical protein
MSNTSTSQSVSHGTNPENLILISLVSVDTQTVEYD